MASIKKDLQETQTQALEDLLKQCRNERETRRVQCVLLWTRNGWSRQQISEATGYAKYTVRDIQLAYLHHGEQALVRRKIPKEKNQYLKRTQEAAFLHGFHQSALEGELVSTRDIKNAFESRVGKQVAHSTIYRLLHRNGWRKITPRPKHPKSDAHERERFKKTPEIAEQTEAKSQGQWMPAQSNVPG